MVEIPDLVRRGAESIRFVNDRLRFVNQSIDGAVVDQHPEVVEDVIFVAPQHPGEVAQRRELRMGRPPAPVRQLELSPNGPAVLPEEAEAHFEEVRAVDLQLEPFEATKPLALWRGEMPRLFQPDEARLVQQRLAGRPRLADLVTADLVDGGHEMAHNVELIEHQHRWAARSVMTRM